MKEPENDYHLRVLAELELQETIIKFNGDRKAACDFINKKNEITEVDLREWIEQQLEEMKK